MSSVSQRHQSHSLTPTYFRSEIEGLRAKHDVKEAESATLSTQSQAMLNLNLMLQNTALKSQAKAVDLDLAKLQARVSKQQAEILQVRATQYSRERTWS